MRSIMVLNSKGGSGKSTIATNLASYYASQGKKTVLVDCDPQSSSLDWLAARSGGRRLITGIDAAAGNYRIPRSVEYAIYDTPAAVYGKDLTALLRKAESIIIPVLPSPVDMRAATPFIQTVYPVGECLTRDGVALIANRCRENTNIYHLLEGYLRKVRKAPFLTVLRES